MVDKASAAAQVNKGMMRKEIALPIQFDEQMIESEQLKRSWSRPHSTMKCLSSAAKGQDTREIVGAEVLARWINIIEWKARSPAAEFIPPCAG